MACDLKRRVTRRVQLNVELLEQPWVRAHFQAFCYWERIPKVAGNLVKRIDRYATFFAQIDRHFEGAAELSQAALLSVFGAEGLRRGYWIVAYLVEQLHLAWSDEAMEAHVECGRIEALVAQWKDAPWATDFDAYRTSLCSGEDAALRLKTQRVYLNAAARFLESAGADSAFALTQAKLGQFLRRSPGQRASLAPFVRFIRERYGVHLRLAKRSPPNVARSDRRLIMHVRGLLQRIEVTTTPAVGRALLAAIIAKTYQIPLKRVLQLTPAEIDDATSNITLWPKEFGIQLSAPLDRHFRRWAGRHPSKFAFAGRNGAQALSYDTVRYHVR